MTSNQGTVTLKAASVNGGNAVLLNASSVIYSMKNNLRYDPIISSYSITEVEHRGWENPKIHIRGTIRDVATTNEVTDALLKEFAKVKNEDLVLNITWGSTGNEATFGNVNDVTTVNGSTGFNVKIETINFEIDPTQRINAHVIPYTMTLVEDKI